MAFRMAARPDVENLGARSQNRHLRAGVALIAAALLGAMALRHFGFGGHAYLVTVPLLLCGVYALNAGLARTCAVMAMLGKRRTASGAGPIADRDELAAVRKRGAVLMCTSMLIALAAAGLLAMAR
jgi:hypothetical protein